MDFLRKILASGAPKRTLYIVSEADIDAMDDTQKRAITNDPKARVALYSDHIEKITMHNALRVDGKFHRATTLVSMIREMQQKPDTMYIGEHVPNTRLLAAYISEQCPYLDDPEILTIQPVQTARGRSAAD